MPDLKPTSLDTALEHIDEGHYVFPVRANKAPACKHGFNAAVNTPEEAEQLWRGKDAPLLGIDCGRSDIWVLDIDPDGLGWLDKNRNIIPETQCYQTPRGGYHYVFTGHPAIRISSNEIAKGVANRSAIMVSMRVIILQVRRVDIGITAFGKIPVVSTCQCKKRPPFGELFFKRVIK